MPKTFYPELEKPKKQDLSRMDWDALLDKALRAERDYELRRQIDAEMRKRVARGWIRESYCPRRMFHA